MDIAILAAALIAYLQALSDDKRLGRGQRQAAKKGTEVVKSS